MSQIENKLFIAFMTTLFVIILYCLLHNTSSNYIVQKESTNKNIIIYNIDSSCNSDEVSKLIYAFELIEDATNKTITFKKRNENEFSKISIDCSIGQPANNYDKRYYTAGITRTYFGYSRITMYPNWYLGKPAGYPTDEVHEILHALGIGHSNNESSIMYPININSGQIDEDIIKQLKEIYK